MQQERHCWKVRRKFVKKFRKKYVKGWTIYLTVHLSMMKILAKYFG